MAGGGDSLIASSDAVPLDEVSTVKTRLQRAHLAWQLPLVGSGLGAGLGLIVGGSSDGAEVVAIAVSAVLGTVTGLLSAVLHTFEFCEAGSEIEILPSEQSLVGLTLLRLRH